MACNGDLPLAAGRIKLRISNMCMSHNVLIDFLCRALREFILCFHFVLIGPYFYSICPYIALWRHLALKTRHLASRHLALKALSTQEASYPCFYAKNEIFLLFTIVESIQCCLFVKQVLAKVVKKIHLLSHKGRKKITGGLTKSINSINTWGIKFKLIKQFWNNANCYEIFRIS